jgi:hypothetical protein
MFMSYAEIVWEARSDEMFDPKKIVENDIGLIVTYPIQCLRVLEIFGLYGLARPDVADEVADWLARFIASQPGASHPVSDRWAVSLIPALVILGQRRPDVLRPFLTDVLRWLGDRHDNDGLGMAGPHAEPFEEVEYFLGSPLESVEVSARRQSYLAAVMLDVAALLEDEELYNLAYNEVVALDIRPFLAIPRDDVSQYMTTGHGIDVPMNTSPNYAEYYADGSAWRMAAHHDDDTGRYYLGRIGRLWDHLSLSTVTRDRHWVAGIRVLLREPPDELLAS